METALKQEIRRAQSCLPEARDAVREFHAAVAQTDMALVIFFCSGAYDLDAVADEMRLRFSGTQVVGCTTAGEIGPQGYGEHSIVGVSFPAETFSAVSGRLDRLRELDFAQAQVFAQRLQQGMENRPRPGADNRFALLLIDGLSEREEAVTRAFQHALNNMPLVGGSAGDGLEFGKTFVYHAGRFVADSAVLTLVSTTHPVQPFLTQHFTASERWVVVTDADPEHRLVREIDGRPAATAYAELVGVAPDNLDPMRFAASPMVVTIGGTHYVRSISEALPDGSLKFFCAIDEGMVLRVARGENLVGNLAQTFATVRAAVGAPQVVIGCDCILRRLEILQNRETARVEDILRDNNVVGFNSYGEQFGGIHINQTFTGIAIGDDAGSKDD